VPPLPGALPHPADIFGANLVLAVNILTDHWTQLMADLAGGRCFSWLGGSAALGPPLSPPPPATAAAVDARLAPSPDMAAELERVCWGGGG
jgi:auxin responsive GH3 family protein